MCSSKNSCLFFVSSRHRFHLSDSDHCRTDAVSCDKDHIHENMPGNLVPPRARRKEHPDQLKNEGPVTGNLQEKTVPLQDMIIKYILIDFLGMLGINK